MKIGFHIIGSKGLQALQAFVDAFGGGAIAYVVAARDGAIQYDAFDDIASYCSDSDISFVERGKALPGGLPRCDAKFAIGWRWLIDDAENLVVFHDSPLPRYRGFAPLVNMLVDGCGEIAVTALLASAEYDRGDIVAQAALSVDYPLKISEAIDMAATLYARLAVDVGSAIQAEGTLKGVPQDDSDASYSLWRDELDYRIDFSRSADEVCRFIDAVGYPYNGASASVNGSLVRVLDAVPVADVRVENRAAHIGKIIFFEATLPVIVCGSGLLKVTDLRDSQGEPMLGKLKFRTRFEGC